VISAVDEDDESPASPTSAGQRAAEATLVAEIDATPRALIASAQPMFGPVDGELTHSEDAIGTRYARISVTNFVADASFVVPYATSGTTAGRNWSYGFFFRSTGSLQHYRVYVRSNRRASFGFHDGGVSPVATHRRDISLSNLRTGAGEINTLRLVVSGGEGWLYVNNNYVMSFNVSAKVGAGDIGVGTGFVTGDVIPGRVTRYTGFEVRSLSNEGG
jgi:hypothetical protein